MLLIRKTMKKCTKNNSLKHTKAQKALKSSDRRIKILLFNIIIINESFYIIFTF